MNIRALMCIFGVVALLAMVAVAQQAGESSIAFDAAKVPVKVTVKYTPAAAGGKKVFGGMVPYNQVWPIGGTSAAIFHTDDGLVFKGVVVPKGDYSLYLLPEADKMTLIINKQTGPKTQAYNQKLDLGRVPMVIRKATAPVEPCKLAVAKTASRGGRIEFSWENTVATIPFALDWAPGDPEW